jgi:hypothetical protein
VMWSSRTNGAKRIEVYSGCVTVGNLSPKLVRAIIAQHPDRDHTKKVFGSTSFCAVTM